MNKTRYQKQRTKRNWKNKKDPAKRWEKWGKKGKQYSDQKEIGYENLPNNVLLYHLIRNDLMICNDLENIYEKLCHRFFWLKNFFIMSSIFLTPNISYAVIQIRLKIFRKNDIIGLILLLFDTFLNHIFGPSLITILNKIPKLEFLYKII